MGGIAGGHEKSKGAALRVTSEDPMSSLTAWSQESKGRNRVSDAVECHRSSLWIQLSPNFSFGSSLLQPQAESLGDLTMETLPTSL